MIAETQVHLPAVPPAAPKVQAAAQRLGAVVWSVLHQIGASRARGELLRVAQIHEETNPELAARLRKLVRDDWLTRS